MKSIKGMNRRTLEQGMKLFHTSCTLRRAGGRARSFDRSEADIWFWDFIFGGIPEWIQRPSPLAQMVSPKRILQPPHVYLQGASMSAPIMTTTLL